MDIDVNDGELRRSEVEMLVLALPPFPESVRQIREVTSKPAASPRHLVDIVERDPVLTGHLLKLVNSSYFGLSHRMESVKQAVVFIGMNTTKHLAMCVAALGTMPHDNTPGLPFARLRRSAVFTAAVCREIALDVMPRPSEADSSFMSGLLHNLGQIALMVHRPDAYRHLYLNEEEIPASLEEREYRCFGIDRYAVSAMMATRWQIATPIIQTIQGYANFNSVKRTVQMDILYAAVRIVAWIVGEESEFALPQRTEEVLGLTTQELISRRRSFDEIIGKAQVFLDHG